MSRNVLLAIAIVVAICVAVFVYSHRHMRALVESPTSTADSADVNLQRLRAVEQMTRHAWSGFYRVAAGHDEVQPLSGKFNDRWGGIGITAIDSMDTLLLMGLKEEFHQARELTRKIHFEATKDLSPFETVIRHVGAAVAVSAATQDEELLAFARYVADGLLPSYEGRNRIPRHRTRFGGASRRDAFRAILSEAGSSQLEFRYLSYLTRNQSYAETTNAFTNLIHEARRNGWPHNDSWYERGQYRMPHKGLFPAFVTLDGQFDGPTGLASFLDSFYEYILKQWILFGKQDEELRVLYNDAVEGILLHLVRYHKESGKALLGYHGGVGGGYFATMDHLSCFAPGMLMLGVMHDAHNGEGEFTTADIVAVASDLMETCYSLYDESPSGLAPDVVEFVPGEKDLLIHDAKYLLRPETIESLFYMYRFTHDDKYREWGWNIASAIEKHCKTSHGYAAVKDVRLSRPPLLDSEESFFIAETLKYLYLLFADDDVLPLDEWLLTTEGHPLPIIK